MSEFSFCGRDVDYWLELESRKNPAQLDDLLIEIHGLRGKISFYESRIRDMMVFVNKEV